MVVRAEQQSEQRFGSAARRDPGRGVCVLRLTIAGPSERISRSAPKMKQLEATEAQLRAQIAELEQQKVELADPVYIAAQARQRLGFVMPGDVTYQVRLPSTAAMPSAPGGEAKAVPSDQPWYTALWHTIADEPHGVSPKTTREAPPARPAPPPPRPVPPLPVVERSDLDAVARQLSGEPPKNIQLTA